MNRTSENDDSSESEEPQSSTFCEICQHRFLNEYNFMKHMWRHGDGDQTLFHFYKPKRRQKNFVCNICKTTFGKESTLRVHLLSHNEGVQAFSCEMCSACFDTVVSLQEHCLVEHKQDKKPIDILMGLNKVAAEEDIRIENARSVSEDISEISTDENMEICITDARSVGNDPSKSSSNKRRTRTSMTLSAKIINKRAVKVLNVKTVKKLHLKNVEILKARSIKISYASNTTSLSLEDFLKPCFVDLGSKCTTDPNVRSFKLSNVTNLVALSLIDFLIPCFVNLGRKKYGCDICHKMFLTQDNYELHLAIHDLSKLDNLPLRRWRKILPKPTEGSKNKDPDYESRLIKQKTTLSFKCMLCRKEYKSKDALQYHVQSHRKIDVKKLHSSWMKHKRPELAKFIAESKLKAAESTDLEKSKESPKPSLKKPDQLKPFTCLICGTGFLKEDTLRMHSLTHNNKLKKFTCTTCSKEFSAITLLQKHYLLGHDGVQDTSMPSNSPNKTFDQYKGKIAIGKPRGLNATTGGIKNTGSPFEGVTKQGNQTAIDNSTGGNKGKIAIGRPRGLNATTGGNNHTGSPFEGVTTQGNQTTKDNPSGNHWADAAKVKNGTAKDNSIGGHCDDVTKQGIEETENADMSEDTVSVDDPNYLSTEGSDDETISSPQKPKNTYSKEKRTSNQKSGLIKVIPKDAKEKEISSGSKVTYKCDSCSSSFKLEKSLQTHKLRTHSDVKSFDCDSCSSSFKLEKSLRLHQLSHSDVKTFICFTCKAEFNSIPLLQKHCLLKHKGDIKAVTISRDQSKAVFKIVEPRKRRHGQMGVDLWPKNEKIEKVDNIIIEHETAATSSCPPKKRSKGEASSPYGDKLVSYGGKISSKDHDYCPNAVVDEITCTPEIDNMTRYSVKDADETGNCGESSSIHSKDNAKAEDTHQEQHNNQVIDPDKEPLFGCSVCDERFFLKDDLKEHLQQHKKLVMDKASDSLYCCDICNECFFVKRDLMKHLEQHNSQVIDEAKDPRYACDTCNERFVYKGDLKKHQKQHKKQKQRTNQVVAEAKDPLFCCGICDKSFVLIKEYSQHHRLHKFQDIRDKQEAHFAKIKSSVRLDTETESLMVSLIELDPSHALYEDEKPTIPTNQTVEQTMVSESDAK